ncbi:PPOX class F420-dependent oxidoreductase [Halalkalicoccus sp. NIPERK01]|uniref:PPOX class F420-dependent oxidoreductase n=1 Tax=Halalkalicoccus sp. NIPERK01 TaxID=3053469 RepID=UPI00256F3A7E|nr:PPOX class F420-dependent oxidoreductase [Halalkalicoccus sp. NIPERK01]MDL5361947.1 PPOX class F420-dependent oxidoreductase [Halalkalicoccus sp. NIPERK01]
MEKIPEEYEDLFERRTFAHFATLMEDGTPQVTPVWVDYDGEHVLINTARGRQKERNVSRDPKVGVSIADPDDPYRFVSIRGEVEAITEEGAVDHIDSLARRYMDVEEYPYHGEEGGERVVIEIRPDRVVTGQ